MNSSPLNVLVVDDNVELGENVCEILESIEDRRVQCTFLSSARAAREFAAHNDIALALIDVHLPDDRGTALLAEIKRFSEHAQVIVITGDASIETAIAAVEGGAFSYLVKPFESKQLLERAKLALGQASLLIEREQLRAELEASEEKHRNLVENVPAFVLALDENGQIVLWNRYLEEVTGYTRREMLGQLGEPLVSGDEDQPLVIKHGGHRWVRWQRAVVIDRRAARLTYAMGIDVTDERQMLQRTLRSERLAAVGTLAAGLAHEVRNPLNSALLQLQVLERRISKGKTSIAELAPVVLLVKDEIRRLEHLVADFLAFARPNRLEVAEHSVNSLAESVVELLQPEAKQASTTLVCRLAPEAGTAPIDPEHFRQVLLNLVRNAIDACAGGGTVEVVSARHTAEVTLEVRDNGAGFPPDAEIFDAFYTTKEGGTGLGLSIVHRLVTAHGGRITATSGGGITRFVIHLPTTPARGRIG